MNNEIQPHAVYTTEEAEVLLKVSKSTVKRMLKNGLIRANKIGKQYRILGKELLRLVSPEVEVRAAGAYMKLKKHVVEAISNWE